MDHFLSMFPYVIPVVQFKFPHAFPKTFPPAIKCVLFCVICMWGTASGQFRVPNLISYGAGSQFWNPSC